MTDKPNCPDFILAETTDGLVLSYCGDEFTIDDEMRKDLREYLMKDVIKELEIKYSEAESHHNLTETYDRQGRWQYATRMDAWRYALSLIGGEGK